jgi:hypothetical protein
MDSSGSGKKIGGLGEMFRPQTRDPLVTLAFNICDANKTVSINTEKLYQLASSFVPLRNLVTENDGKKLNKYAICLALICHQQEANEYLEKAILELADLFSCHDHFRVHKERRLICASITKLAMSVSIEPKLEDLQAHKNEANTRMIRVI